MMAIASIYMTRKYKTQHIWKDVLRFIKARPKDYWQNCYPPGRPISKTSFTTA